MSPPAGGRSDPAAGAGAVEGPGGSIAPVEFPAEHLLSSGYSVAFAVPAAGLSPLLSAEWLAVPLGPAWRPAPLAAGYGVLAVAYHDFSDSPAGPYRQLSLAVAVHVGARGRGVRGLPLLPILWQSLGGSRPLFPTLGMAVVLLVASTPEAVTYSCRLWGEPAFTGGVEAVADEGGGRRMVELRAHLEGPPGLRVRVAVPAPGRATTREDRRYRLFSRLGGEALADYMHVRAPCRRSLAPRRGTLVWTAPGGSIVERRPLCLLVMEYGPGSVVFGGPRRL
ncbi:MAG: hypothetical protein AB1816_00960 [Bacillota bacterium]